MRTDDLIALVADVYDLEPAAITGDSRKRHIVQARQAAAWLLRMSDDTRSLAEIGALLGGRDHTTIMHAIAQVEARRKADPDDAALLDELRARCATVAPAQQLRRQIRIRRQTAGAWWAAQSMPWRPIAA